MYETILLSNLICRKEFRTEALSYLRKEYFQDPVHRWTFIMIADYVKKYGEAPTKENLLVDLARCSDIEQQYRDTAKYIDEQLKFDDNNNLDWLLATTQEFCGSRAVEHEMYDCIAIIGDKDRKQERPLIPSKLQAALTLSFKQPDDDIVNHFKNYKPPKYLVEDLFEVGKV